LTAIAIGTALFAKTGYANPATGAIPANGPDERIQLAQDGPGSGTGTGRVRLPDRRRPWFRQGTAAGARTPRAAGRLSCLVPAADPSGFATNLRSTVLGGLRLRCMASARGVAAQGENRPTPWA
jgi:hypothetical protein